MKKSLIIFLTFVSSVSFSSIAFSAEPWEQQAKAEFDFQQRTFVPGRSILSPEGFNLGRETDLSSDHPLKGAYLARGRFDAHKQARSGVSIHLCIIYGVAARDSESGWFECWAIGRNQDNPTTLCPPSKYTGKVLFIQDYRDPVTENIIGREWRVTWHDAEAGAWSVIPLEQQGYNLRSMSMISSSWMLQGLIEDVSFRYLSDTTNIEEAKEVIKPLLTSLEQHSVSCKR